MQIVGHRLDRQTSGICVFAKNKEAARTYSEVLKDEKIHKVYIARVIGKVTPDKFVLNKRIYF